MQQTITINVIDPSSPLTPVSPGSEAPIPQTADGFFNLIVGFPLLFAVVGAVLIAWAAALCVMCSRKVRGGIRY